MQISQIHEFVPLEILRDGQFNSLGVLSHDRDKMLVSLYDQNYLGKLLENKYISCVITNRSLAKEIPKHLGVAISDDPLSDFYSIHNYLLTKTDFYWKDFDSEISPEAVIHERAYISPKNVRIGPNTRIDPNVTVLEHSVIGKDVIIRANAVIGSEGFEPKDIAGRKVLIPHAGGVLIHDGVEIQSNAQIDKALYNGFTAIGENTKIEGMVYIGHHVRVGKRCEITACAIISGSTTIGDDVFIGPNATISSEIKIGNGAFITLGSVVTKDVDNNQRVSGNFAIDHKRFLSFIKSIR